MTLPLRRFVGKVARQRTGLCISEQYKGHVWPCTASKLILLRGVEQGGRQGYGKEAMQHPDSFRKSAIRTRAERNDGMAVCGHAGVLGLSNRGGMLRLREFLPADPKSRHSSASEGARRTKSSQVVHLFKCRQGDRKGGGDEGGSAAPRKIRRTLKRGGQEACFEQSSNLLVALSSARRRFLTPLSRPWGHLSRAAISRRLRQCSDPQAATCRLSRTSGRRSSRSRATQPRVGEAGREDGLSHIHIYIYIYMGAAASPRRAAHASMSQVQEKVLAGRTLRALAWCWGRLVSCNKTRRLAHS